MLQIESLLSTLTQPELDLVRTINLKGKQRQVMQALLQGREEGKRLSASDVGISPEHFHQILSVLLQRCYATLAPGDLLELATFLVSKNLTKLLYQQLRLLETRVKTSSKEEQEAFYNIAFETSQWVLFDDLNLPLVEHFGKQYLKLKQPVEPGDKLYVEIRIARNTIDEVFAAGIPGIEQKKGLKRRLELYRKKLQTVPHSAANYQLHVALSEYNILLERDPLAALAHLQAAQQFINTIPEPLLSEECSAAAALRADIESMLGNFDTAYKRYEAIWADPEMQLYIKRDFYHTIRFAEIATIVGNLERAREILDRRIDSGADNLFIARKYVRYAVIALLDRNVDEARRYIEEAYRYNTGKSYAYLTDIRLRFLEVVSAYLSEDWHLASTLITRTLQFLHRKKVRIAASDYGYYFKFVNAAIRYRETGNPIPQKITERIKRNAQTRFFSLLLDKIGAGVSTVKTMLVFGAMSI